MNTNTPYEKLLAAKLDEIAVPDMSDDIWSNIEAQLDGVVQTPQKSKSPRFKGRDLLISAGAILTVSVIVFYFATRPHPVQTLPEKPLPPVENVLPVPADTIQVVPVPVKKRRDTVHLQAIPVVDSFVMEVPASLPEKEDTVRAVVPVPDTARLFTPVPKVKKFRGVKGINSEDYKLSTKRDTVRQ